MPEHTVGALVSNLFLLAFVGGIPLFALIKRVDVFNEFVTGGKEGFQIAVKIIPYLLAFLVAIGMFRAAGGFQILTHYLGPVLQAVGFPEQLLPMALLRPFSGSASNAMLADVAHQYGGQSHLAHTAAILMGSTETTFYVAMVYFAAVGVSRMRHAIFAGLIADSVGICAAIYIGAHFF
jgi:spore maturation protein B